MSKVNGRSGFGLSAIREWLDEVQRNIQNSCIRSQCCFFSVCFGLFGSVGSTHFITKSSISQLMAVCVVCVRLCCAVLGCVSADMYVECLAHTHTHIHRVNAIVWPVLCELWETTMERCLDIYINMNTHTHTSSMSVCVLSYKLAYSLVCAYYWHGHWLSIGVMLLLCY